MKDSNSEAAKTTSAFRKQFTRVKQFAREVRELRQPPEVGRASQTQMVLPFSVVRGTRRYLEAITHQINGSYEKGWYDACAVMMRKLLETLIIEVFEQHQKAAKIQTAEGDFENLDTLIKKVIGDPDWNLSRTTKQVIGEVKQLGNNSAHGRRFNAHRGDIDGIKVKFRTAVQEFVQLCGWP